MSEVIWRKLKTIDQIILENPGCKKYSEYDYGDDIELTLTDESNGIYWTINDEMLPMFGNDEEYAFRNRTMNKIKHEESSYTHYLCRDKYWFY